jgi:hypothetical protein
MYSNKHTGNELKHKDSFLDVSHVKKVTNNVVPTVKPDAPLSSDVVSRLDLS